MLSALQEHVSRLAAEYWHQGTSRNPRPGPGLRPHDRAEPGSKTIPSQAGHGARGHGRPGNKALPHRFPPRDRPEFVLSAEKQRLWEEQERSGEPSRPQEEPGEETRHGETRGEETRQERRQQWGAEPDGCPAGRPVRPGAPGLPWGCGYAEAMNHNKSHYNEDQAACLMLSLVWPEPAAAGGPLAEPAGTESQAAAVSDDDDLFVSGGFDFVSDQAAGGGAERPAARGAQPPRHGHTEPRAEKNTVGAGEALPYWALFDGHGGPSAAAAAARTLHELLRRALQEVAPVLAGEGPAPLTVPEPGPPRLCRGRDVSRGDIVVGAIESAFLQMDQQIERERLLYDLRGGCTALVALCALGNLYVANAGDSRAVIVGARRVVPMSHEFTPVTERQRLQRLASDRPELLGELFTPLEFGRRVLRKEVGMKVLYRAHHMTGWAYKTATEDDLRFPLISGVGKQARLFSTIGVTRGFGNHDLLVHDTDIGIKPFLSSTPEVMVHELCEGDGDEEVLVMGTDGLWDVLGVDEVAALVRSVLCAAPKRDPARLTRAAVELVRAATRPHGSPDDVSVFVIPLRPPSPRASPGPPQTGTSNTSPPLAPSPSLSPKE